MKVGTLGTLVPPVVTENSVRSENKEVPIIREIMVATTMSSLFVALFTLVASSFSYRAALPAEILALRHQFAVFLWLANCYFTHDSSEFPVLLPFFDVPCFLATLVRLLGPGGVVPSLLSRFSSNTNSCS